MVVEAGQKCNSASTEIHVERRDFATLLPQNVPLGRCSVRFRASLFDFDMDLTEMAGRMRVARLRLYMACQNALLTYFSSNLAHAKRH